jgi:hypothetical protein
LLKSTSLRSGLLHAALLHDDIVQEAILIRLLPNTSFELTSYIAVVSRTTNLLSEILSAAVYAAGGQLVDSGDPKKAVSEGMHDVLGFVFWACVVYQPNTRVSQWMDPRGSLKRSSLQAYPHSCSSIIAASAAFKHACLPQQQQQQ